MSENLFHELYSTFGDDFLEVCFNIYLVACGDRKATLIESANYVGQTARFYANLKAFLASSKYFQQSGVLETREIRLTPPKLLIYNSRVATPKEVQDALKSNTSMGRLLGMECAGQLGDRYTLRFIIHQVGDDGVEVIQDAFYTEVCSSEPNKANADRLLKQFSAAAERLWTAFYYFRVTQRIEFAKIPADWIHIMTQLNDHLGSLTLEDRDNLADILDDGGFEKTTRSLKELQTIEDFTEFLTRYRQILLFLLLTTDNDPIVETFGSISVEDNERYRDAILTIEDRFYELEPLTDDPRLSLLGRREHEFRHGNSTKDARGMNWWNRATQS